MHRRAGAGALHGLPWAWEVKAKDDPRIAFGAVCTWWGPIQTVGHTSATTIRVGDNELPIGSLPCCPHCGGMLMEVPSIKEWDDGAAKYEADGHPFYAGMIAWAKGRCFATMDAMAAQYFEETGIVVR